jgi:hypothetical protein
VPDTDLPDLVRRRLWELSVSAAEASRRSRWVVPPELFSRLGAPGGMSFISERLAGALARALDVPENRVRRAAGLAPVDDPRVDVPTGPHLRLVRTSEQPPPPGSSRA